LKTLEIILGAYFLGSIPFGYLAGRARGVDVREHGSGNIGATNVLRVLGKKYGFAVFFADALKGLVAVRLALWLNHGAGDAAAAAPGVLAAILVVVGHSFPIWLGFRGGKGVATSAGACLGLLPLETCVAAVVWVITFLLFRFVSLASVAGSIALPLCAALLSLGQPRSRGLLLAFTMALAALVIVRHRGNIQRLVHGTEPRFERK